MKIAICYSGLSSRLVPNNLIQQLEIFSKDEKVDLFFSLWNDGRQLDHVINEVNTCIKHVSEEKIKLINVELKDRIHVQTKYNEPHRWPHGPNPVPNMVSMYTSIKNADNLRQQHEYTNNFQYDIVIKSRPDVGFDGEINYKELKHILDNEALAIFPKDYNWFNVWRDDCGCLNDQFFIANSPTMSHITNMDLEKSWDNGCRVHPESSLWWRLVKETPLPSHLQNKEIPWYKFMNFMTILRGHREVVSSIDHFKPENIQKFKLDKILPDLQIPF